MKELRRSHDRRLLGVAGGMAEYFDIDPVLVRAAWVLICFPVPPALLVYFILGLVLPDAEGVRPGPRPRPRPRMEEEFIDVTPPPPEDEFHQEHRSHSGRRYRRLTKSRDRWIGGVAGGIADYFDVDPVLIRALLLASIFLGGTGLLVYLILLFVMPQAD